MSERRYVVGFLFTPLEDAVLLAVKNRPAWQAGKLNGIGGHVEDGETFDAAMHREAMEEAGVDVRWTLFAVLSNPTGHLGGADPWTMHCYRATAADLWTPPEFTDVGEALTTTKVRAVVSGFVATIPNLRWLIPMAHPSTAHDWPYRITERASPDSESSSPERED